MVTRNYAELSSYDFEHLVRDLLQADWGRTLETFPAGPDGGVDIRGLRDAAGAASHRTVQCKHSPGKTWSAIKASLEREATNLKGRKDLGEYWLATSASLTAAAKSRICKLFCDQDLQPERVLAREDLDNLLNQYPRVEEQTYKLYMTSPAILQKLLNNAIHLGAQDLLSRLTERRRLYVQSKAFPAAVEALRTHHYCVLSGPPGVGKTTLGEMLMRRCLEEGYQPVLVGEDIDEASQVWSDQRKQAFFYDDFLGTNSLLDKLAKNEDNRLIRFIQRVQESGTHLIVLMTREYILQQANLTYERLVGLDSAKVVIDLRSYSDFQKAHILYNHIYFSDLSTEARLSLLRDRAYRRCVNHRNYNPASSN